MKQELSETMKRIVGLLESNGVEKRQYRRKLEAITGVSYSGVSQWFTGSTKKIEYPHIKAIADYYKTSVEYLMCTEDESESSQLDQKIMSIWNSLSSDSDREMALSILEGAISGMQKTSQDQQRQLSSLRRKNALNKA